MTPALLPSFSVADTYNGARLEQRTIGLYTAQEMNAHSLEDLEPPHAHLQRSSLATSEQQESSDY